MRSASVNWPPAVRAAFTEIARDAELLGEPELVARSGLAPSEIGLLVYGQVVPSIAAPNIAREIGLLRQKAADHVFIFVPLDRTG